MKEKLFDTLINAPIRVMLLIFLLIAGAGYGGQYLTFKADYKIFFGEDSPLLMNYEAVQAEFSKSDNVAFVIAPNDGNVFTPETLTAIREITEEAWQIPYSSRVDSLTNFQHTQSEEDDLSVADLVAEDTPLTLTSLNNIREIALNEPLLIKKLVAPSANSTVVNVTVQLNEVNLEPIVMAKAREMKQKYEKQYPDLKIMLSGMVMMNGSFSESAIHDNEVLVPLMFAAVIVIMIALLKSFTGTFATVVIVITSIVSAMGLAGWTGLYLSGPSASSPVMILTLAVADCIHVMNSMFYEMRQGKSKSAALKESLRLNFQPIMLTSITTAIGFLSMNFSESPPFRDLGNIVAIGVMMACILSLTLFPALMMILPVRVKPQPQNRNTLMMSLGNFVIAKSRVLLPTMALIIAGLTFLLPQNTLNDNFVEYFDESMPIRTSTSYMQENMSGIILMEVAINSQETGGISGSRYIQTIDTFSNWFRQQPEVDHVSTLSDTFKRLNKNMHADNPDYYRLPENRELAAQYLLLYEMSLPYGLDLNNQINVDKSATRVVSTLKNISSVELLDLEQRVTQWLAKSAPDYKVMITGPDLMFAHIGQSNIESMLSGTAIALVLICGLLGLALGSFQFSLISLVPNIAPAAMGFGAWYLLSGEVGLGLSMVAGMTLGIVVDYTVHFLSKYLHARRDLGADTEAAVRYTFNSVGNALWVTTIVLVIGFSVLAHSHFKLNGDMGFLTAVTIVLALVVDFFFLPPLLLLLDRKKQASATSTETDNDTEQTAYENA
ncbi:efflux RND transporter permease subunit [Bacterioplanoides sp.]|uniref:efflux RND transporter permease subunit n=1 Tax=Bacterioplanoides sp. TaxID=2066072 RepID=UPI003B5C6165